MCVQVRWEGTELYNYSPLIYGYQLTDVAITGGGIINGSGSVEFASWKALQHADQELAREMGNSSVNVSARVFGAGHYLRPQLIQMMGVTNLLIEGITLVDSPFWTVNPVYVRSHGSNPRP